MAGHPGHSFLEDNVFYENSNDDGTEIRTFSSRFEKTHFGNTDETEKSHTDSGMTAGRNAIQRINIKKCSQIIIMEK